MYGKVKEIPQNENTPFYPRSPYGVAKVYAHWITVNYREAYDIFACNGILFNHESPRRGGTFVTKKIINGLCRIKLGMQNTLYLGNLDAKRDWGHAKDYVVAMWKMLQNKKPTDYVISTGLQYTVREFVNLVLKELNFKFNWLGKNMNEKCIDKKSKKPIIKIDKAYFRPLEVDTLLGNSTKAKKKQLNWKPTYNIRSLIKEMIHEEILSLTNDQEKDKIYIAGHKGLIGSAILRKLILEGYKNIITIDKKKLDLTNQSKVNKFIKKQKPKFIFLLLQQKLVEFFQIINLRPILFMKI